MARPYYSSRLDVAVTSRMRADLEELAEAHGVRLSILVRATCDHLIENPCEALELLIEQAQRQGRPDDEAATLGVKAGRSAEATR